MLFLCNLSLRHCRETLHHSGPKTAPLSVCFPYNHLPSSSYPTPGLRRKAIVVSSGRERILQGKFIRAGVVLPSVPAQGGGVGLASRVAPRDVIPPPFHCLFKELVSVHVCGCLKHIPLRTQGRCFRALGGDCGMYVLASQHLPWVLAHSGCFKMFVE